MIADKMFPPALFTAGFLAAALGGGAFTGWLTAHATRDDRPEVPSSAALDPTLARQLEALAARLSGLEAHAGERGSRGVVGRTEVGGSIDAARLRALVEAMLAERGLALADGGAAAGAAAEPAPEADDTAEQITRMLELGLHSEETQALWETAHAEGRLEELARRLSR